MQFLYLGDLSFPISEKEASYFKIKNIPISYTSKDDNMFSIESNDVEVLIQMIRLPLLKRETINRLLNKDYNHSDLCLVDQFLEIIHDNYTTEYACITIPMVKFAPILFNLWKDVLDIDPIFMSLLCKFVSVYFTNILKTIPECHYRVHELRGPELIRCYSCIDTTAD